MTSSLPPRSRALIRIPWSYTFAKNVQSFLEAKNFTMQYEILKQLAPKIKADCFQYKNKNALQKGKLSLLKLWEKLLDIVDVVPFGRRGLFYSLIVSIIMRYEFDLIHLCDWQPTQDYTVPTAPIGSQVDLTYSSLYRQQLVKTQHYVTEKMKRNVKVKVQTKFCIQVLAITFFRLPILSGPMLTAICSSPNLKLPTPSEKSAKEREKAEKKKKKKKKKRSKKKKRHRPNVSLDQLSLDDDNMIKEEEKDMITFEEMLGEDPEDMQSLRAKLVPFEERTYPEGSWQQQLMYDLEGYIKSQEDPIGDPQSVSAKFFRHNPSLFQWLWFHHPDDEEMLEEAEGFLTLAEEPWFYEFLGAVVTHVARVAHGEIRWGHVPGYWVMVKVLLIKMLDSKAMEWPQKLTNCCSSFLVNSALLDPFTKAALFTTSATNPMAVNHVLDLLDMWFNITCPTMSTPIPDNFCFDEFYVAMQILMNSEHFQMLLKTLWFFYTHCGHFYGKWRIKLFRELFLNEGFFRLFLHWSPEVRRQYHIIIAYRLNRGGYDLETQHFDEEKNPFGINNKIQKKAHERRKAEVPLVTPHEANPGVIGKVVTSVSNVFRISQKKPSSKKAVEQETYKESEALVDSATDPLFFPSAPPPEPLPGEGAQERPKRTPEQLKKAEETLEDHDPAIEGCVVVYTPMTNEYADRAGIDMALTSSLAVYVRLVQDQLKDLTCDYYKRSLNVYAEQSLEEFSLTTESYERVQAVKNLRFGEILVPELCYSIVNLDHLRQNDNT